MGSKKEYKKPELETYGNVNKNTNTKDGVGGDNQGLESN